MYKLMITNIEERIMTTKTITVKHILNETVEKKTFSCLEEVQAYVYTLLDQKDLFVPSKIHGVYETADWIWTSKPGSAFNTSLLQFYFFSNDEKEKLPVDELEECQKENELNYYGGRA